MLIYSDIWGKFNWNNVSSKPSSAVNRVPREALYFTDISLAFAKAQMAHTGAAAGRERARKTHTNWKFNQ